MSELEGGGGMSIHRTSFCPLHHFTLVSDISHLYLVSGDKAQFFVQ